MVTHPRNSWSRLFLVGILCLVCGLFQTPAFANSGSSCTSGTTPAFSAPPELHLPGVWRPGSTGLTCDQIPRDRDSSDWESLTVPGLGSGHENFQGLDVLDNFLYVAYNAGISVWDLTNPERPSRTAEADGWPPFHDFFFFPDPGEDDFFIEDIAVIKPSSGGSRVYIAVSGRSPVGFTIWDFNTNNGVLNQLYQNPSNTRMVRLEEYGSTIYAFAGHENGIDIYNVSQAISQAPCLDGTNSCPGVFVGEINTNSGGFIDILKKSNGITYISNSDGNGINTLGVDLWQLNDPSNPGGAIRRFSGLDTRSFGTALFEKGGDTYMGVIERVGSDNRIKIFDIDACLNTNCGATPGTLTFNNLAIPPYSTRQFLTYSEAGTNRVPFLYYGLRTSSLGGDPVEHLLDLTTLGTGNQNITEITDGGPTYFDDCQNRELGYWSYYYPGNEFGAQNFTPRIGKFNDGTIYFYRAAKGILDVHIYEAGSTGTPTVTTTIDNVLTNYWMNESFTFSANGSNGCVPLANGWTWDITTPAGVSSNIVNQSGNQVTVSFSCDDSVNRCADADVTVSGQNTAGTCAEANENPASITVQDPRLEITSITPSGGSVPQCTVVNFEAIVAGRGPADFAWSVDGVPEPGNSGTTTGQTLPVFMFNWDTTDLVLSDELFVDGFESGDVTAWSGSVGVVSTFTQGGQKGVSGTPFLIELGLDSSFSGAVSDSVTIGVELVGSNPSFQDGVDPITATSPDGGATWDFVANTVDASDFTWEFEDADGTDVCTFGEDTNVACVIGTTGPNISHTWVLQSGTKRVNLTIGNCLTAQGDTASTTVDVVNLEPLEVTDFGLVRNLATNPACDLSDSDCIGLTADPPLCSCSQDEVITFELEATGSPTLVDIDWNGDGTFEDAGVAYSTTLTHTYASPIAAEFTPAVRVRRNSATSDPQDAFENLIISN